jgi:hypothetical protein
VKEIAIVDIAESVWLEKDELKKEKKKRKYKEKSRKRLKKKTDGSTIGRQKQEEKYLNPLDLYRFSPISTG